MSWTSFFFHLADFALPVVFMTLCMTLWHTLKKRVRWASRWWVFGLSLLATGFCTQIAILWWMGLEGSLLGYGILCAVLGGVNWVWTWWVFKARD